jgi:HSP20 family protein
MSCHILLYLPYWHANINGIQIEIYLQKMQIMFHNNKKEVVMLPVIRTRGYKPLTLSDFFNEDFFPTMARSTSSLPSVNIREDEKAFYLELAVPGMDKKDLRIEVKDDVLTISSEHKEDKEEDLEGYRRREFSYSSFCRSFYLPEDVNSDKIGAAYKDGILNVEIPKLEEEKKKEKIRSISIS